MKTAATSALFTTAAASVTGAAHARTGSACQDAHRVRVAPDWVVLGAADGVGSAPLAAAGARAAVDEATSALARSTGRASPEQDWAAAVRRALVAGRDGLVAAAGNQSRPPTDLATTLLVAVLTPSCTAVGQVGNGAAVAECADGPVGLTVSQSAGRYADQTRTLAEPDFLAHAQVVVRNGPVIGLSLLTDGLEDLCLVRAALGVEVPHPGFFTPLFAFVRAGGGNAGLRSFLDCERVREASDDDRTLAVATAPDVETVAGALLLGDPPRRRPRQ
jgi:hypothetical protein